MNKNKQPFKKVAGIDIAKNTLSVCILDTSGHKEEIKLSTSKEDLLKLQESLNKQNITDVVMENTGVYSEPIIHVLKYNFKVISVNAADTTRKNLKKTDPSDAEWLAYLALAGTFGPNGQIRSSHISSDDQLELKTLTRSRARYVSQCTSIKNRITKSFDRFNIKIMNLFKDNKFTDTAIEIYKFVVSERDFEDYISYLTRRQDNSQGRERNVLTRQIRFLNTRKGDITAALNQKVVSNLPKSLKLTVITELHILEEYNSIINLLTDEIDAMVSKNSDLKQNSELLCTIPGVGENTASQIVAELPPIEWFDNSKQLASYTGLTPSVYQSADVTHIGNITKRGSSYLRKVLFQIAQVASMRTTNKFGRKFKALYAKKGKGKGKLVWTAIARHIATVIWSVLKHKNPYHEDDFHKRSYKTAKRIIREKTIEEIVNYFSTRNYKITIFDTTKGVYLFE
jgi:transposase